MKKELYLLYPSLFFYVYIYLDLLNYKYGISSFPSSINSINHSFLEEEQTKLSKQTYFKLNVYPLAKLTNTQISKIYNMQEQQILLEN